MAVEKLICRTGELVFPDFKYTGHYYRYDTEMRIFHIQYEYWYDGVLFLFGNFLGKGLALVEVETGAFAVSSQELPGSLSVEKAIEIFKKKLLKSGLTVHEVVRNFKNHNLDLELWLVNSLII